MADQPDTVESIVESLIARGRCPGAWVETVPLEVIFGWKVCCGSPAEHRLRIWQVCEHPERPLDLHGLFSNDCDACRRAWKILGCLVSNDQLMARTELRPLVEQ